MFSLPTAGVQQVTKMVQEYILETTVISRIHSWKGCGFSLADSVHEYILETAVVSVVPLQHNI